MPKCEGLVSPRQKSGPPEKRKGSGVREHRVISGTWGMMEKKL